jgi:Raf kinase inhibitor-like YbhB/YbcL family protein
MKRREFITLLGGASPLRNSRLAVILFAASLIILWGNAAMTMTLKSPAFQQNGHIPSKYTCEGEDVSPPLAWEGAPNGAKSLVLIIDDPDAPDPKAPKMVWVHWVVYNMPPDTKSLPENAGKARLPQGALLGLNDFKKTGYGGPCPPIGRHRYFHKLYALDITLDLRDATKSQIERAMRGHVLANAELIGTYQKGDR